MHAWYNQTKFALKTTYSRSFKELLTFFLVFNFSFLVLYFIWFSSSSFHDCIILKPPSLACSARSYIKGLGENYPIVAIAANGLYLPFLFFIYFPLLNYCEYKIANKKIPYAICGGVMMILTILFFTLTIHIGKHPSPITSNIMLISAGLPLILLFFLAYIAIENIITKLVLLSLTKAGLQLPEKWTRVIHAAIMILVVIAILTLPDPATKTHSLPSTFLEQKISHDEIKK